MCSPAPALAEMRAGAQADTGAGTEAVSKLSRVSNRTRRRNRSQAQRTGGDMLALALVLALSVLLLLPTVSAVLADGELEMRHSFSGVYFAAASFNPTREQTLLPELEEVEAWQRLLLPYCWREASARTKRKCCKHRQQALLPCS